uniref:Cadherin-like domain-containing protein n=1 Tax=Panagrellus redivivus TaxID=6233 RepID=A0A7E4VY19_PANRE
MDSRRCILTLAFVFVCVSGAPTLTGYLPTTKIDTISSETGLTASATPNGISLALKTSETSSKFAIAIEKEKFSIGIALSGAAENQMLKITVTNPKTGKAASLKLKFSMYQSGLGHILAAQSEKLLGSIENHFVTVVVSSDGTLSVDPAKSVRFAALECSINYDATHNWFLMTLESESVAGNFQVAFGPDVLFLTRQKTASTGSWTPTTTPSALPKNGGQSYKTETSSDDVKTGNASFLKSKWWIIVLCIFLFIALIVMAGSGVFCAVKKMKSKTKGLPGGVTDKDADGLTKPSGKNTEDTVFGNMSGMERPPEQDPTKTTVLTETTEQKDTTVEPDTVTQTQKSKANSIDIMAKNAPVAKLDPNYQTSAAVKDANKASAMTTVKVEPKKNPNYQRVDGINDSIMTSTKADKPSAKTEKAPPKKPEGNYQTVASSKTPNLSADSTGDKASAQKADKTASKKPKRYFFKRTTGTDEYPETTVTEKVPIKQVSKSVPKTIVSSKDAKSVADNDKVTSQKADNTASKKPKRFFLKRTTGTDDYPDTIVGDKASATVNSKAVPKEVAGSETPKQKEDLNKSAKVDSAAKEDNYQSIPFGQ